MYKRDFGILLLSVCALYFSLKHEGAYQFKKAWYHSFAEHEHSARHLEEHPPVIPPPLVADLNGDGKPEIVTATPGGAIQLLAPRRFGDGFAKAEVLSQVELDPSGHMRIAALAAGYLSPPPKELVRAPRKQAVVVVTTALKVICLNHNLQKEWEADMSPNFPSHGGIREVAVHISDQSVSKGKGEKGGERLPGDKGLVVVGASVIPLSLAQRLELESELEDEAREELLAKYRAHGRRGGMDDEERAELQHEGRHFSYFAFEGASGSIRWVHEPKDFHRNLGQLADSLVAQHAYHMQAEESEARHYGEASCRDYRASVLAALPHSWDSQHDTRLVPAHFVKHKQGAGSQKQQLSKLGTLKTKQHGGGVPGGINGGDPQRGGAVGKSPAVGKVVSAVVKGATKGEGPASARRRKEQQPPNVLVAHLEEGIEAIHLFSGRTVCRLHLPMPGLHVDLNGDGVPEHIVAVGGDPEDLLEEGDDFAGHAHERYCYMSVHAGIPARQHLFNGTICRGFGRQLRRTAAFQAVEVAPPIFLPLPGKHGHYRGGMAQKGMAVILNSRGELTAYDSEGEMLWQHFVGATWTDPEDEEVSPPEPTLKAMPLRPGAVPTVVLAAGESSATVVSERGNEVDSWDLPDTPAMPLQLVDFNFDRYTDVILVSHSAIWGWAQVRHPGALPFTSLVAALMVIMAAIFVSQQGFMQAGGGAGGKRRPLRSTDRED